MLHGPPLSRSTADLSRPTAINTSHQLHRQSTLPTHGKRRPRSFITSANVFLGAVREWETEYIGSIEQCADLGDLPATGTWILGLTSRIQRSIDLGEV